MLIQKRVSRLWNEEFVARGGTPRGTLGEAIPLRALLEQVAELVFGLTVINDESLAGTNIEGELNRVDGLILIRPGLPTERAAFVIAHEIGHHALDHPLHAVLADTAATINPDIASGDLSAGRQAQLTGLDLSEHAMTLLRGYNERDYYEIQANAFATELLVPGDELRRLLESSPLRTVGSLAAHFGVAHSLMRVGMANTLLFAAPAGAGDDPPPASVNDDLAAPLDPEQRAAADCAAPALIVAGPGAGKTRILVSRYARLVSEGIHPRHILALTFTNRAAGEMRERIAARVGEEHAASVEVFTFHAFGLQLLQQYGGRIGLKTPLRLVTPMDALLLCRRRAANAAFGFLSGVTGALESLRTQLKAVSRAKEENAGVEEWERLAQGWRDANPDTSSEPDWVADGATFYADYQRTLRRRGLLDYGDLQTEALRLFTVSEVAAEIRERYQHILVDEFQDINYVSGGLTRELDGGRGVVWVVGDPRQSIFGFRGASPVNLSRFFTGEYYPSATVVRLGRNYRSVPAIVRAGAGVPVPILGNHPGLVPPDLNATRPASEDGTPAVMSAHLPDVTAENHWIAAHIRSEEDRGRTLSDMAVLVRKRNHAERIAAALTRAGIPHRWAGPIHERPVFRVLVSALLLAADDTRGIAGLSMLPAGAGTTSDFALSETDRRALFADRRGRWGARKLLRAAAYGGIVTLSGAGRVVCRELLGVADALSVTARPHHNLSVYLFEHARWFRSLLSTDAKTEYAARAVLATVGQTLDLAAAFATGRDALASAARAEVASISTGGAAGSGEAVTSQTAPTDAPELPMDEDADRLETGTDTGAFLAYVSAALESGGLGVSDELPRVGDAVSILTAHSSKGLEWGAVFVPVCVEGEFPVREREDTLPIPPPLIQTDDATPGEAHEREEACVFYVAVTRARDKLYLSSAARYGSRSAGAISSLRSAVTEHLAASGETCASGDDIASAYEAAVPTTSASDETAPGPELIPFSVREEIPEYLLRLYEGCPRKYLFAEIYDLPQTESAFLNYHQAVYNAARDAGGDPVKFRAAFARNWEQAGPDVSDWQTPLFRKAAERLVSHIEKQMTAATAQNTTVAYRQSKTLPLGTFADGATHALRFSVDEEITPAVGPKLYRRHKSGTQVPKTTPDDSRAKLYALHADHESAECSDRGGAAVSFYYPHAGGVDLPVTPGTKAKCNRLKNLKDAVERMKRGVVAPTVSGECDRCPYQLICSRE